MKARTQLLALEPLEDRSLLATCTVTNLLDVGRGGMSIGSGQVTGDLRFCINYANAMPGHDTISFEVTGTINLKGALPVLSTDMNIVGPGSSALTVRRNTGGNYRIFTAAPGAHVRIVGLTIANGRVLNDVGGGILNRGTLTLENTRVNDNEATNSGLFSYIKGGGIYNEGALTITGSTIDSNSSNNNSHNTLGSWTRAYGGGIYNTGTLTIDDSTLSENRAVADGDEAGEASGGGIHNEGGTVTVSRSAIDDNNSDGFGCGFGGSAVGGGIGGGGGSVTILDSTLSANEAMASGCNDSSGANGGAIGMYSATLLLTNSTLTQNTVDSDSFGFGAGGIFIPFPSGVTTVTHSTIAGNGGGIDIYGSLTIKNSIVANNGQDVHGQISSSGYNLIGNSTGGSGYVPSDILNVDPMLGPLAQNGGLTFTMALLPSSPAIDSGTNHMAPQFDQRGPGFPRIVNGTIDIGAFEVQSTGAPSPHGRASVLALATSDALKGRDITAQGNALGNEAIFAAALKGRDHRTAEYGVSIAPLLGLVHRATFQPRALPWPDLFRPVGAEGDLEIFS